MRSPNELQAVCDGVWKIMRAELIARRVTKEEVAFVVFTMSVCAGAYLGLDDKNVEAELLYLMKNHFSNGVAKMQDLIIKEKN